MERWLEDEEEMPGAEEIKRYFPRQEKNSIDIKYEVLIGNVAAASAQQIHYDKASPN
jgi:hypothetical protein